MKCRVSATLNEGTIVMLREAMRLKGIHNKSRLIEKAIVEMCKR